MRSRPALSSPGIWPKTVVALDHAVLHLDGATHGVNYAAKLDDAPVAGALHHAPVMHGDGRVDEIAAERTQPRKRPLLVCTSKLAWTGCFSWTIIARTRDWLRSLGLEQTKPPFALWNDPKGPTESDGGALEGPRLG